MNPPLVRRAQADLDVIDAVDHCLAESLSAAEGFVAAPEKAYGHIRRAPATGSPRWAHELNIPGLRSWPCSPYPQRVFYGVSAAVRFVRARWAARGARARYERRHRVNACCYALRTGCARRLLPKTFPSWQASYISFSRWVPAGVIWSSLPWTGGINHCVYTLSSKRCLATLLDPLGGRRFTI